MVLGESFKPIRPGSGQIEPKKKPKNVNDSFFIKYTFSFLAASCAETITYPLDLVKGRLQIQGEIAFEKHAKHSKILPTRGMIGTALGIVYSGVRMTLYEYIREELLGKNTDGTATLWKALIGGTVAGVTAQFLASPADLVKVQVQMEGRRRLMGLEPRVKNARHAFSKIYMEGGIRGLWKGWMPNCQRAAFVNLGDLTTYDTAKHLILKHTNMQDNYYLHALSSVCSGLVAALLGTPADVIKTRVMNQPTDSQGKGLLYKSSVDCLIKSVQGEGFFSLYKGFIPCWIRMGPWSLLFWLSYEKLRHLYGVTSF
ncbi:mitochondrial uncoupling protein 4-like protein [Sarcoptes scabiei]|uniref:Mitochondrial uncoupling protein 4-like protein n=1 Tax=Sarcoptes scabiei TaxID=52283 RepID=A0A132A139_SARSC|nr:mitochondrial uncoupling protein 4-like protein [Sarcoptes scabiei]